MFLVSLILIVGDLLTNKKEQVFVIALLKSCGWDAIFHFRLFRFGPILPDISARALQLRKNVKDFKQASTTTACNKVH